MKANWISKRRDELGINQEELAARLQTSGFDISRSTLSHWENGRYNPPLHDPIFRKALADALRMNARTMLKAAGYEVADSSHSEDAERAASIIEQLPEQQRKIALGILEQFLANSGK